jgi:hypothetical protein
MAHEPSDPPSKQLDVKVQKASRGWPAKPTSSPIEQIPAEQPSKVGLPSNLPTKQTSEAGLPTKPPTEQPSKVGYRPNHLSSNPARRGCRPTCTPSNLARRQSALGRTPLLKGRADLVPSSHVGTMEHHQTMPRPCKRHRRVSIKHNARYVSSLTSGTGQPQPQGP